MRSIYLQALITICLLTASEASFAGGDVCDFANSGPLYPHDQVLDCYENVPFNPADLQNAIEVISAYRERSSIREIYDQRINWRASLQTLGTATFSNDYAFQVALVQNHKEFDNAHFRYQRPWCYVGMVTAFVPFEFGSTVVNGIGQIVFVEATPYLAAEYQASTGIDTSQFIGQRVVSINGVDALEYFRQFGRTYQKKDTNDGMNLSGVLTSAAYSLRLDTRHDLTPPNAVDSYVFAAPDGSTTTADIPWMYAPRTAFSWGDPLTSSTAEFIDRCLTPGPGALPARDTDRATLLEKLEEISPVLNDPERGEKKKVVALKMKQSPKRGAQDGFFEVPPDQLNQFVDELVPWTNSAKVLTLPSDNTTVIRIADFQGDWQVPVRTATEYACANSDRLIVDLRYNLGGQSTHSTWLTRHLLPDAVSPSESRLPRSFLNEPGLQELALRASISVADFFGEFECRAAFNAACYNDAATGQQLSNVVDQSWVFDQLRFEDRAEVSEPLTRKFWFNEAFNGSLFDFTGYDPISCPGKFENDSLIVLTNGSSFSAGYFWTEKVRDWTTIVTAGGFVGEPLVSGTARGGGIYNQRGVSGLEQVLAYDADIGFGPPIDPLPEFTRDVNVYAEMFGAIYRANGVDLHVDNVPYGDIQIPVWSDSPETDGYVYRSVLAAVASAGDTDGDGIMNGPIIIERSNVANGVESGGVAIPIQAAAYDGAAVYDPNLGTCADAWTAAGTLCDESPTTNSATISTKTTANSGATYTSNGGLGTGVLVVDLGAVKVFDKANVFQMFSDGKTTHFRISAHPDIGDTPPDWQDAGWTALSGFEFIGPGVNANTVPSQVTDPTSIVFPQTISRYVMVEVRNDGTHGDGNYIELRAFKLMGGQGPDNCTTVANANQIDSNGDGIGNACDLDFNNDCNINFLDFAALASAFGPIVGTEDLDVNSDGIINFLDIAAYVPYHLSTPGPSALGCN